MYHHLWDIVIKFWVWNLTGLKSSNVFSKVVYIPNSRIIVERKSKSSNVRFIFSHFVCRMSTRNAQRKMLFSTGEFRGGLFREWFLQTSCQKAVWKTLIHAFNGMRAFFLQQNAVLSLARNIGKISVLIGILLYACLRTKCLSWIYIYKNLILSVFRAKAKKYIFTYNVLVSYIYLQKLDFERFSRQSKNFFQTCSNPYKSLKIFFFWFIES